MIRGCYGASGEESDEMCRAPCRDRLFVNRQPPRSSWNSSYPCGMVAQKSAGNKRLDTLPETILLSDDEWTVIDQA